MRALGIDYGDARIGLAISDDLGMMAHPLETVDVAKVESAETRIAEVAREKRVDKIVMGLPLRMDGSEGPAVEKVKAFTERLRSRIDQRIEVIFIDERLSTVEAQRSLREAGRNVRNSRSIIDQAAACIILQDYLDQQGQPVIGSDEEE
ncbi:MAG: Holliday junction resolvase RuvX [Verrucomicrobiales bacterium]|nr:Holliday junction resolvase RuvX [Verrucomicrobiae bacterium]